MTDAERRYFFWLTGNSFKECCVKRISVANRIRLDTKKKGRAEDSVYGMHLIALKAGVISSIVYAGTDSDGNHKDSIIKSEKWFEENMRMKLKTGSFTDKSFSKIIPTRVGWK